MFRMTQTMAGHRNGFKMMRLVHNRSPRDVTKADEEALEWIVRLTSGVSTSEDHARFRRWRDASSHNAEALARGRELWALLGTALVQREREPAAPRARRVWLLPIAASLLVCIGIGQHYWRFGRFDAVTAIGERRTVVLSDGTRVMLAADSALSERINGRERRVSLGRGQAFFSVKQDRRPFVVEAGGGEIRDVGTAFDVAWRTSSARVTVAEGVVSVRKGARAEQLAANQSLDIAPEGLSVVRPADVRSEIAWTSGRLVAAGKPLGEVIAMVAPYSRRRIVLLNRSAAQKRVSAVIELDKVDQWLAALEKAQVVRATSLPGVLILS